MARYQYVLFDADNTLFDFDRSEWEALGLTLEAHGIDPTQERKLRYQAINAELWAAFNRGELEQPLLVVERFAVFLREFGLSGDPAAMNADYLNFLAQQGCPLPGAEALCAALAPHCTLALVTNGLSVAQRGRYDRSPLRTYLPHLFISQELGYRKPQKEFFDRVFEALAICDPRQAVVVGDSLSADIQGAVNAGMDSIWYNPKGASLPAAPRPTYVAPDFDAVRRIILG